MWSSASARLAYTPLPDPMKSTRRRPDAAMTGLIHIVTDASGSSGSSTCRKPECPAPSASCGLSRASSCGHPTTPESPYQNPGSTERQAPISPTGSITQVGVPEPRSDAWGMLGRLAGRQAAASAPELVTVLFRERARHRSARSPGPHGAAGSRAPSPPRRRSSRRNSVLRDGRPCPSSHRPARSAVPRPASR